jgi:hypothetical protein
MRGWSLFELGLRDLYFLDACTTDKRRLRRWLTKFVLVDLTSSSGPTNILVNLMGIYT